MSPRVLVRVMEMLLSLVRALFGRRADLALENLALRQQVAILKRERPRPPLDDFDRAFWVALKDRWSRWSDNLILVRDPQ
jgi:putative transposase